MKHAYLEVTYRKGRPMAAYYYLPRRRSDDRSVRTEQAGGGLLIDYSSDGKPHLSSDQRRSLESATLHEAALE